MSGAKAKVLKHPAKARYEAGRPSPYHLDPPRSQSADAEIGAAGIRLRNWARQLADNSSIVSAILSSRVSNAIGPGLTYEPLAKDRKGNLIPELNDSLRRIHEDWSRSVDVTGEFSRQELERLAWRTWDLDGETFVRKVPIGQGIPYRLQQIESDWIPLNTTQLFGDEIIVHGVGKDTWGRPLTYYVDPRQQGDIYGYSGLLLDPERMTQVPSSDMWHLKRIERVNQTRGVTLLHSVIFRVADIAEYQQSHRLAARASSDLYASINRSPDMNPDDIGTVGDRTWQYEHLQMLDELMPGESVNFHDPRHPNQNAVDFVREELRSVASACDVGFSQIAQVFDSSYAAQRLEVVDTFRKVDRDRSKFIGDFARRALYEEPINAARRLTGLIPARLMRRVNPDTFLDCRIDGPQMPVIDPVKDRAAYALDQEHGWDSRYGIIRRMGKTPAQVDDERATDPLPPESAATAQEPDDDTDDDTEEQA